MRDPDGHSYGTTHEKLIYSPPKDWQQNENYLYGCDLYNNAYWWESHEQWEDLWHTTNKEQVHGQFLQGLIQISAAFIKWHLNQHEGMSRLYMIGRDRLEFVRKESPIFMGLDLNAHLEKLEKHFAPVLKKPEVWPNALESYPFIII